MISKNSITPFFSIAVFLDKPEHIVSFLDSCFNSISGKLSDIEIIILDVYCIKETIDLCSYIQKKYGDKIRYEMLKGFSMAEAYNYAIYISKGIYLNFNISSSFWSGDALVHIYNCIRKYNLPKLISAAPWTVNEQEIFCQYNISPRIYDGEDKLVDLNKEPGNLCLCLHSYFIRDSLIKESPKTEYFTNCGIDTSLNYLIRMMYKAMEYIYVSYAFYNYTVPMEDNTSAFLGQYEYNWYFDDMEQSLLPICQISENDSLPEAIQRSILWSVFSRFNCNYNDRDKKVLSKTDVSNFFKVSGKILEYIEKKYIWKEGKGQVFKIPRTLRLLLFDIKSKSTGHPLKILLFKNSLWLYTPSYTGSVSKEDIALISGENPKVKLFIDNSTELTELKTEINKNKDSIPLKLVNLEKEHVIVDIINYDGDFFIDGRCSLGDFDLENVVTLFANVNGKYIFTQKSYEYLPSKIFGKTYQKKMRFRCRIPEEIIYDTARIEFFVEINGVHRQLKIISGSIYSHITEKLEGSYWRFSKHLSMELLKNALIISACDNDTLDYREEFLLKKIVSNNTELSLQMADLRKGYHIKIKEKVKPIWVTFDKLYKAGDNGEYIFKYVVENDKEIDIYYLIKDDSPDFSRLKKEYGDRILVWGRKETLITMLAADVILTTHTNVLSNAGFTKDMIPYITDLFNPVVICIQHGLTVQNIAQYQNRIFDNIALYCCASPNEINNLSKPIYGYSSNMLKMTGICRYDGLHSRPKRQILISPTWRRNVANSNIAHFKKAHNAYFKNSEYFRLYNSLINDRKLIEQAKKLNYKITYLIHPAVSSQIEDFDKNDYVEIVPAAGDINYEKILCESDLMVTDYSGIQFDFAYMKKPLIYYHPETLPPHYDESEDYVYERDAFGPIIKRHQDLVDVLCQYMMNNCKMDEKYKSRVDNFFYFHDYSNCKRVHETIVEYVKQKEEKNKNV